MIHRQTTKELIAESLKELFVHKSADKITVKEIAQNCGITTATFYNHFLDKYDLIVWIYAEPLKTIFKKFDDEIYCLHDAIYAVVNYFAENRKFIINAITHTSGQDSFICHVFRVHFNAMSDYIKLSQHLEKLPLKIETLIKLYVYGTVQLLCEWLISDMPVPIDDFVDFLESGLPEPLKVFYESKPS